MSFKKGHSKEPPLPKEHVEMMAALWAEGSLSASQVAQRLNDTFGTQYTRCSVLGKVRRLGLALRKPGVKPRIKAPAEPKVVVVTAPPPPPPPEITPLNIPFAEAQRSQCRWMVDAHTICGAKTEHGPWCAGHRAIVYTKRRAA